VRVLFPLVAAAIAYGSLYPFAVVWSWPDAATVGNFLATWDDIPSRGDVLGNVILFIPYGLFGRCVWPAPRTAWTGVALAVVLQLAQFWIDGREPQIQDMIWNGVGLAAGIGLASVAALRSRLLSPAVTGWQSPPAVLVAFWMASIAVPFVPTVDLAQVVSSLKPLLRNPWPDASHTFLIAASWLAAACMVQEAVTGRRRQWLTLMALVALAAVLKLVIVGNRFQAAEIVGTLIALPLWFWRGERTAGRRGIAGMLLLIAIVWGGLDPVRFRSEPGHFYWLPFGGALNGAVMLNLRAVLAKIFIYGGAIWLLSRGGARIPSAGAAVVGVTLCIEIAQVWTHSGTPEITDPLMALAIALLLQRWKTLR
jgi:glycopeptide antibiotics resistance protein